MFYHNLNTEAPPPRCHQKKNSENMQKIYKTTPMPKYNFNKVPNQITFGGLLR